MSTLKHINYLKQLRKELCEAHMGTTLPEDMDILYNKAEALDAAIDLLQANNKELLPCPFCGGSATMRTFLQIGYYVQCIECEIMGQTGDSETEARIKWNTRTNT